MTKLTYAPALTNLPLIHQGKTRDTFSLGEANSDLRLIVATDRLSTHNVIHKSTVPRKDETLTALTIFWLIYVLGEHVPHHLVAYGREIYNYLPGFRSNYPNDLHHRAIVVKTLRMHPIEIVYRDRLAGSLYNTYYKNGLPNPYGIDLLPGLQLMHQFSSPIFTLTEKSETDDPVGTVETHRKYPAAVELGLESYLMAKKHLKNCGIEMIDTKLEAGIDENGVETLGDEVFTPDSSRFCEASEIKLGVEPKWLDKEQARKEAERIWGGGAKYPITFDPSVISGLTETYLSVFERIVGTSLGNFQKERLD